MKYRGIAASLLFKVAAFNYYRRTFPDIAHLYSCVPPRADHVTSRQAE